MLNKIIVNIIGSFPFLVKFFVCLGFDQIDFHRANQNINKEIFKKFAWINIHKDFFSRLKITIKYPQLLLALLRIKI